MVLSGLLTDHLVQRAGRYAVFWTGGGGMAAGALLLAVGRHPTLTIAGAGIMGLAGTGLLATIQSALADRHGPNRVIALTESNVAASFAAGLSPLLVGGLQRAGIGWRGAIFGGVVLWALAYAIYRDERLPVSKAPDESPAPSPAKRVRRSLPRAFWIYWTVQIFGVAAEWTIISWGADVRVGSGVLSKAAASATLTFFFAAMVIGRATGSRLTRVMDQSRLLLLTIGIGLAGVLLFWLSPLVPLTLIGLFVAGLGVANFYPFVMSISVGIAADQVDRASARITLASGLAILLAPQTLGTAADQIGIERAFGLVVALLVLAAVVSAAANRLAARQSAPEHH
jgi:MFS family permease